MAEEADADPAARTPSPAPFEKTRQLRLEHATNERRVALLQLAIVASLVGEVEVHPARVSDRRLGLQGAESSRTGVERIEPLRIARARALERCLALVDARQQQAAADRDLQARREPVGCDGARGA